MFQKLTPSPFFSSSIGESTALPTVTSVHFFVGLSGPLAKTNVVLYNNLPINPMFMKVIISGLNLKIRKRL